MSNQTNDLAEGFKMTELGPLPEQWETVRLGDAVKTIKGRKPDSLMELPEKGSIPYLTADYFRTLSPSKFVKLQSEASLVTVGENDIVLIWDGSNAGDVFSGLEGILASTMVKMLPKLTNLESRFLYFFLKTQFDLFNSKTTGSTVPHVNKQLFQNLTIPLPQLPEQKAIARVLTTVQKAIEAQDKIIAASRELKKSLMRHLFTYGSVSIAKADHVPLKETEIGPIPEHWEVVRLETASDIIMGQAPSSNTYNAEGLGLPFFQGKADFGDIYPTPRKWCSAPAKIAEKDDVLLSVRAPIGDVNVAKERCCIGRGLAAIRSNQKSEGKYLFYRLAFSKELLESKGTGTTFKEINKAAVTSFMFPLPPLPEQKTIALILSSVDEKIKTEENRKAALQTLFKTMLHLLMTGKVRVKDLEVPGS
jgi:type I restriction enzyme S subunit